MSMNSEKRYSPVGGYLAGHYRVPVCNMHDLYTIYVGDKFTRVFNSDTLPDEVKVKLTMINALPVNNLYSEEWVGYNSIYIYMQPDMLPTAYRDVGWRVTESLYCLLLTEKCLMDMRGKKDVEEVLYGVSANAGSK